MNSNEFELQKILNNLTLHMTALEKQVSTIASGTSFILNNISHKALNKDITRDVLATESIPEKIEKLATEIKKINSEASV